MTTILETERLLLRRFTTNDANFIVALLNSPGWLKFIGDRNVKTREQAVNYLVNGPLKSYELNGFGLSMVELKNEKIAIGMCGLLKRDYLEYPDIGFAFLPEFTGKGLAAEMATAMMSYAKDELKLGVVCAITTPENINSIKMLRKIAMTFTKEFYTPDSNERLMLYSNQET